MTRPNHGRQRAGAPGLDYWTPPVAVPVAVLPLRRRREPVDWLSMLFVVAVAAGLAFSIVVALAWVLGH